MEPTGLQGLESMLRQALHCIASRSQQYKVGWRTAMRRRMTSACTEATITCCSAADSCRPVDGKPCTSTVKLPSSEAT